MLVLSDNFRHMQVWLAAADAASNLEPAEHEACGREVAARLHEVGRTAAAAELLTSLGDPEVRLAPCSGLRAQGPA